MSYQYLPLETVEEFVPYMGSELGRAADFLAAFRAVKGNPDLMRDDLDADRELFLCQEMARIKLRREPLWSGGEPTARHLGLIAWAYSPHAKRVIG